MAISQDTFISDLEDAIALHISTTMAIKLKKVKVRIGETELPRPLVTPILTIETVDGVFSHIGGMDVFSNTQQAKLVSQRFVISIITDESSGGKKERANISSLLALYTFGATAHDLLTTINGRELTCAFSGNAIVGPSADQTQYIAEYVLTIDVILPYLNLIT